MGLFNFFKRPQATEAPATTTPFQEFIEQAHREIGSTSNTHYLDVKVHKLKAFEEHIMPLPDAQKVAFVVEAVRQIEQLTIDRSREQSYQLSQIWNEGMRYLLKTKLEITDSQLLAMADAFLHHKYYQHSNLLFWPLGTWLVQVERQLANRKPSPELLQGLEELKKAVASRTAYHEAKEAKKLAQKIETVIFSAMNDIDAVKPFRFVGFDEWANHANPQLESLDEASKKHWYRILHHAEKASSGSPSKKYLDEAQKLLESAGKEQVIATLSGWFGFVAGLKDTSIQHVNRHDGREYRYTETTWLATPHIDVLKGLVWMAALLPDKNLLVQLAALAERSYRKIPGKGPAAMSIGNACFYVLGQVPGMDGVGHLSRLRLRIKQNSVQNLIEKYLNQAAKEQGITTHDIEDRAVDAFGLQAGQREYTFNGYKAVLKITGVGKTSIEWFKPDGTPQKSVPALVKEQFATELKALKETIKQVETTLSVQRDRIDRLFRSERRLSWADFHDYYFAHGLMGFLTQHIIWNFEQTDRKEAAIYLDGQWQSPDGPLSFEPGPDTKVSLWHPVFASVAVISRWRSFLLERGVAQPLKQAFREVYLLTDAEINTGTYSNRMAAHLLKQHQFNSLAKTRGWKYALLGAYDDGRDGETATLHLPEYNLQAEYWINEVAADDAFNETGIWLYVATDQVRFTRPDTGEVLQLLDVPALVFTEVMRDVDLFVGVASVGNDPQWRDSGGLPAYRPYWDSYSFGDLTEVAKTRKSLLERLVPRLKIGKVSEIRGNFLVVQGKLRTYKIHIGSTNILMEPNDQYLCIVPDRGAKVATQDLFLPFEGDSGVSVILSKALLLADDDKITDPTITSQIGHG